MDYANSPFAELKRQLALQHRDNMMTSDLVKQSREAVARSRELLAKLPAAPVAPPSRRAGAGSPS